MTIWQKGGSPTVRAGKPDAWEGRVGGQVLSRAVVVATGVAMTGEREVLGCAVGDTEDEAFWSEFLRSLRSRGLPGCAW